MVTARFHRCPGQGKWLSRRFARAGQLQSQALQLLPWLFPLAGPPITTAHQSPVVTPGRIGSQTASIQNQTPATARSSRGRSKARAGVGRNSQSASSSLPSVEPRVSPRIAMARQRRQRASLERLETLREQARYMIPSPTPAGTSFTGGNFRLSR